MWGQICTESSYQLNFNFGFSTYKSDVLLHLSQWQYWWWFWFSFFWSFYYFVILRVVKNRVTKMNLKINTSLRGRGKWGDFLIAILPLSWCANILLNSNFILRMFEWQNESSLFTVRIHGKQWYWVYKFDLIDAIDILTVPKNMGRNRWVVGTPQELIVCESYLQAIQLRSQEDWIKNYWKKKFEYDYKSFKNVELGSLISNNDLYIEDHIFNKKNILKINENFYNFISPENNVTFGKKIIFNNQNLLLNIKKFVTNDKFFLPNFIDFIDLYKYKSIDLEFKKNFLQMVESSFKIKKHFDAFYEAQKYIPITFINDPNSFYDFINFNNTLIEKSKKILLLDSTKIIKFFFKKISFFNENNFFFNYTTPETYFENIFYNFFKKNINNNWIAEFDKYDNTIKMLINDNYIKSLNFFPYKYETPTNKFIKLFYEPYNFFLNSLKNFVIIEKIKRTFNNFNFVFNNIFYGENNKFTLINSFDYKLSKFKKYSNSEYFKNFKLIDPVQLFNNNNIIKYNKSLNFKILDVTKNVQLINFESFIKLLIKKKKIFNYNFLENFFDINLYDDSLNNNNVYYNYDELDDTWDVENNIRQKTSIGPIRLVKHLLTPEFYKNNSDLLKFNFFDNNNETSIKIPDNNNFWVLKQKRYKKKQLIKSSYSKDLEYADFETIRNIYRKHIIENIKLISDLDFKMDPYDLYKCIRGNRNRTESLPIHLYRRLLRTKKTLVLPAHINMTVVTNSYDVVHSWFLPGLGIKMDCVPGRSTHHSLYLDNIGFYYGQCAEICGRYHHHMPIRLCALPFEHFLVWWNLKGLPKLLKLKKDKNILIEHSNLKYTW